MKKIKLKLKSYNLADASLAIFHKIIKNKPKANREEISKLMGISSRTLYRFCQKYNLFKIYPEKFKRTITINKKKQKDIKVFKFKYKKIPCDIPPEDIPNIEIKKHSKISGKGRPIIQYDLNGVELGRFPRIVDAARELKIPVTSIQGVLCGRKKTSHKNIFKYNNE